MLENFLKLLPRTTSIGMSSRNDRKRIRNEMKQFICDMEGKNIFYVIKVRDTWLVFGRKYYKNNTAMTVYILQKGDPLSLDPWIQNLVFNYFLLV